MDERILIEVDGGDDTPLFIVGDQLRDYWVRNPQADSNYRFVTRQDLKKVFDNPGEDFEISCPSVDVETGRTGSHPEEFTASYIDGYFRIGCKHLDKEESDKVKDWVGTDVSLEKAVAVFRNVANEGDPHGHFLTYFAKAVCQADLDNQRLLYPTMRALISKYDLITHQEARGILKPEQYSTTAA